MPPEETAPKVILVRQVETANEVCREETAPRVLGVSKELEDLEEKQDCQEQ